MKLIVNPKTKKQLTKKEKQILDNLSKAVDFVIKYNKGKEDAAILKAMGKGKKTRLLKLDEKKAFIQKLKTTV